MYASGFQFRSEAIFYLILKELHGSPDTYLFIKRELKLRPFLLKGKYHDLYFGFMMPCLNMAHFILL